MVCHSPDAAPISWLISISIIFTKYRLEKFYSEIPKGLSIVFQQSLVFVETVNFATICLFNTYYVSRYLKVQSDKKYKVTK